MNSQSDRDYQKGRKIAMTLGAVVYLGVVMAMSTLFISFVLTAFPDDAYASRGVMTLAGILVGSSMLAFPYALHTWAVSGFHRTAAMILYYLEMLVIGINTVVSFSVLLAKYSNTPAPEWAVFYEPFSIVAIVYTLFAWGTLFLTDPEAQRHSKERAFAETYKDRLSEQTLELLSHPEGLDAIARAANNNLREFVMKSHPQLPSPALSAPAPAPLGFIPQVKVDQDGKKFEQVLQWVEVVEPTAAPFREGDTK